MLSVIVPTLNAARVLPGCLTGLAGADEIIVVDGGSKDDTVGLAEAAGVRVIVAPKGRGTQLRAGGDAARGDWLLFLHADTRLGPGWEQAVRKHSVASDKAACFRFKLDSDARQARLIERGVAARVRLLGLPYGDQGLLISRTLYDAVGGYAPVPLMEDVDIVRRVRRGRLTLLDADAFTSAERWEREGWLPRSARNLALLALFRLGMAPERIARLYG